MAWQKARCSAREGGAMEEQRERLRLTRLEQKPEEEYITVRMPKSSYQAFYCMENYPMIGRLERDETAMARAEWNKERYPLPRAYQRRQGTPRGKITAHTMEDCAFYPGIKHKYWIYTPAQYDEKTPADLILFLDGQMYFMPVLKESERRGTMSDLLDAIPAEGEILLPEGTENVTDLLDNLIADGKLPPTIAVFLAPGYPGPGEPVYGTSKGVTNRSVEYDTVSDWFARFVAEEFLPVALEGYAVTADFMRHSVVGISSSGIAAFAVAWYANQLFGNVIAASPSFGNIRGGNIWPSVIRTTDERKNLRTCMCVGKYDADIIFGDWILANRDVASALNYRGYDFRLIVSEMGHSLTFLKYMIPQALAWFYRGQEVSEQHCEVVRPAPLVTELPK